MFPTLLEVNWFEIEVASRVSVLTPGTLKNQGDLLEEELGVAFPRDHRCNKDLSTRCSVACSY